MISKKWAQSATNPIPGIFKLTPGRNWLVCAHFSSGCFIQFISASIKLKLIEPEIFSCRYFIYLLGYQAAASCLGFLISVFIIQSDLNKQPLSIYSSDSPSAFFLSISLINSILISDNLNSELRINEWMKERRKTEGKLWLKLMNEEWINWMKQPARRKNERLILIEAALICRLNDPANAVNKFI